MSPATLALDRLAATAAEVGFGHLGTGGQLGYEEKRVHVQGSPCTAALSAHAPSRLVFELPGGWRSFSARVALNDDVAGRDTFAHFLVLADGAEVACAPMVRPGESPRAIEAGLEGAGRLELITCTDRWEHCHSVWLEPCLRMTPAAASPANEALTDPLRRVQFTVPQPKPRARRCLASVVSPGFEPCLRDLLLSLRAHGQCEDALRVIIAVDGPAGCDALVREFGAVVIPGRSLVPVTLAVKAALYSIARLVDADYYVCLDADTLVLASLEPVFQACACAPPGRLLACREANHVEWRRLDWALRHVYCGEPRDLRRIAGSVNGELDYPLVVNDGVFAGDKQALLSLDGELRRLPRAIEWMEEKPRVCWWRNQFLFNLALARLNSGAELDNAFNVQLHTHDVSFRPGREPEPMFRGRPARILHFCGTGRPKYPEWRQHLRAQWGKP